MKKLVFILSGILFLYTAYGQASKDSLNQYSKDSIGAFIEVDEEASFPGGLEGWSTFLINNIRLDSIADQVKMKKKQKVFKQTVVVRFIVCKDGSLCEIEAENKKANPMLKAEAVRVIQNSPNWKPALKDGKEVKAYRRQPITFYIEQE